MAEPRSWGEFTAELVKLIGQEADTGGSSTEGTLAAKGNAMLEVLRNGGMPVVKSVQRGKVSIDGNDKTVYINTVDPDKCIVLLDIASNSNGTTIRNNYLSELTSSKLVIGASGGSTGISALIGWQVVEFF